MTYTNILLPEKQVSSRIVNMVLILGCSWMIAASAQYAIQLPISPVPITGQTLIVLLAGLVLGKNRATGAVGLYLLQGIAGLPVFAGGKSGLAALAGPTGGYLFGFLAAAYIVGMLSELRPTQSPWRAVIILAIGNIFIYIFGLVWLTGFVGEAQVLRMGLYPFLIGDLIKLAAGYVLIRGYSVLQKPTPGPRDAFRTQ